MTSTVLSNFVKRKNNKARHNAYCGDCCIAFPGSPQFGHAKAKAEKEKEQAHAKRDALKKAGFVVTGEIF